MSGILGQSAPLSGVLTDIYEVPLLTVATMRVIVTNRSLNSALFRVAVSENGDPIADEHYVAFDKRIEGSDTGSTIGFAVSSGDIVRVESNTGNLSFTATGEERAE
jgi:hypothetical protein